MKTKTANKKTNQTTNSEVSHNGNGKQTKITKSNYDSIPAKIMHAKMNEKIAMGATGVAVAAGVVAAGALLSSKKSREKVGKTAQKAADSIKQMAKDLDKEMEGAYEVARHQISKPNKSKTKKQSSKKS